MDAQAPPANKHTTSVKGQIHTKCLIKHPKEHQDAVKFERYSGPFGCCTCTNHHFLVNKSLSLSLMMLTLVQIIKYQK